MKTILIATDGSDSAREAVELGLELAAEQHARPVVAHVAPQVDVVPSGDFGMTGAQEHELTDYDWIPLEEARTLAAERGIEVETETARRHGRRARRLRGLARRGPDRRRLARTRRDRERAAGQRLARRPARGAASGARRPRNRRPRARQGRELDRWSRTDYGKPRNRREGFPRPISGAALMALGTDCPKLKEEATGRIEAGRDGRSDRCARYSRSEASLQPPS